ncbi:MAG: hypothetical protein WC570_00225 [Patescibacteria group bacterium]
MKPREYIKATQNPSKRELSAGIYKPRLTLIVVMGQFGIIPKLRIELSLPKLLFNNNFDELTDNDYQKIHDHLQKTLKEMGVELFDIQLDNAPITSIHYSKNVPLPYHTTPSMIISDLAKLNPLPRLEANRERFKNGGQSLHYHANSYEIAIYDKIKELGLAKISDKRSIENDNSIQLNLLDELNQPKHRNILRLEIRLNKTSKIKSIFKKINIRTELSFKQLFSQSISQKILLYYWSILTENKAILLLQDKSAIETIETIRQNNPKLKNRDLLELSAVILAINSGSYDRLRNIIDSGPDHSYWYRLKRKIFKLHIPENSKYNLLIDIRKRLNEFIPTKITDLKIE